MHRSVNLLPQLSPFVASPLLAQEVAPFQSMLIGLLCAQLLAI